jgi:hypothetical protein
MTEQLTGYVPVDGNALAGPLRELFTGDVTVASWQCADCGTHGVIAELRVYDHAPGLVGRCYGCETVVLRLVRAPDRAWLEINGTVRMQMPVDAEPAPEV